MIADLKPYREYRPAEGGWLGEVPAHWAVRRMKYIVHETDTRSATGKEQLLRVSQYTGVTQRRRADGLDEPDTRADSLVGYKRVEPNDLVINIMLAWNGSVGVSQHSGITSPAYCVYRFGPTVHPWYFHNLLRSPIYKARIKASSTGVIESRLRLYSDDLGRIEAMLPPLDEQLLIVRFLDWANGRLERAVRAKRKVIALLNEQKQAIIHRAVTRGLDPSAPLKPSGNLWLGDVPRHWEVQRLSRAIKLVTGFPFSSTEFTQEGNGIRLLRGVNVAPLCIRWNDAVRWRRSSTDGMDNFVLNIGDIVLGMDRPIISSGIRVATIQPEDTPSLLVQRVARLRPTDKIKAEFLLLLLSGRIFSDYMAPLFTGISVPHLSPNQIKEFNVALPPIKEQKKIVSYVRSRTDILDTTISHLESEIKLLQEYRNRLVSDIVTGKLDVREAAASIPTEAPLDTAQDDTGLEEEPEAAEEEALV